MTEQDDVLKLHERHTGVLNIASELPVDDRKDLARAYTPGVAILSKLIASHPELKDRYTMSGKLVALITDGSAVLGLGNIGPAGGLPVIEGKALLYKDLAGVNAVPISVNQASVDETVRTIKNIAGSFAGIHLEDIAAPRCFEIEDRLAQQLDIPVYHDDQEGTAIVALAGLINAAKVVGKSLNSLKVVINGVGASGLATAKLLYHVGITHLTLVDKNGVITKNDGRYNRYQREFAAKLGQDDSFKNRQLSDVIRGKDAFIGLSTANLMTAEDVGRMADAPIIFALANPIPEIDPEIANNAKAAVIATGSSQYPNQVNNILVFPGLFKGLLSAGIKHVGYGLQAAVSNALASMIVNPTAEEIVPGVFDEGVVKTVTNALLAYAGKASKALVTD